MGVKVFRGDNWARIQSGAISRMDIMYLDGEKDRELIGYLLRHASQEFGASVFEYAAEKYGIAGVPEVPLNIDDPDDKCFEKYIVLREQVVREEDDYVLREAAVCGSDYDLAMFAFCRLTGYSVAPGECDAYSYRTFECGILPGMTDDGIAGICRSVIRKSGLPRNAAEKCLTCRMQRITVGE
ncbi:MAG: hypothetical protein IKE27_10475 [Oscillospiraceae bacterium]|nr:hypothetical protein [Oscillospiraceae bacterium]